MTVFMVIKIMCNTDRLMIVVTPVMILMIVEMWIYGKC